MISVVLVRTTGIVVIFVGLVNKAEMLEQGMRTHHRPSGQQEQRNDDSHLSHA